MNRPLLFSEEEKLERFQFRQFMHTYFECKHHNSDHFDEPLPYEFIYETYCKQFGTPKYLNEAVASMILDTGGYTLQEGTVWCNLKLDMLSTLNTTTKLQLITKTNRKASVSVNAHILGVNAQPLVRNMTEKVAVLRFLKYMCFTTDNTFYYRVNKHKTSSKRLFLYFQKCSVVLNLPAVRKTDFNKILKEAGYLFYKGYADGVCGTTIISKLIIPYEDKDIDLSLQLAMGVISSLEAIYTTNNVRVDGLLPEQLEQIKNKNMERWKEYEPQPTPPAVTETKEETAAVSGRKEETVETNVGNGKTKIPTAHVKALSASIAMADKKDSAAKDQNGVVLYDKGSKDKPKKAVSGQTNSTAVKSNKAKPAASKAKPEIKVDQGRITSITDTTDDLTITDFESDFIEDASTLKNAIMSIKIPYDMGAVNSTEDVLFYLKALEGGYQWYDKAEFILLQLEKG